MINKFLFDPKPQKITRWERFKLLFVSKQYSYDYHSDTCIVYKVMGKTTYLIGEEKIVSTGNGYKLVKHY